MKRRRYTYIPNTEIESLTTWNGKEFKGSQLLDGAYAKGNIKYSNGGKILKDEYFMKQAAMKGGIRHFSLDIDTETGEQIRENYKDYRRAEEDYNNILSNDGIVYSATSESDVNVESIALVVVYKDGSYDVLESRSFGDEMSHGGMKYCWGGKMAFGGGTSKTIEQKAQELIGDEWFKMDEDQRAVSVTEFITSGVISSNRRYYEGGTIRDEFMYIFEENQPNVDFYEDVDYLTIFSNDRDELEAIAAYLQVPYEKIKYDAPTQTFFIQVDKDGRVMAKGGGVKDIDWANDENKKLGIWLLTSVDGNTILRKSKNSTELEENVMNYYKRKGSVAKMVWDDDSSEGLSWVVFDELFDEVHSIYSKGGGVKEAQFVVTFTVGGKKVVKKYSSQDEMDDGISDFYIENPDVENVEIAEKKKEAPVDIFASAKEEKKKSGKKDEADRVEVEGVEDKISRIKEITKSLKSLEAEEKLLKGEIKELARGKFIDKYEELGRRPDNFRVVDGDEDILFIVQNNYIKVGDEKMALLKDSYPELLGEKVSYKISELMLKKEGKDGRMIGEILSDLIGRSRDITDEDKANLFTITREFGIVDGAIDKLAEYENIEEVYNIIQPIEALK